MKKLLLQCLALLWCALPIRAELDEKTTSQVELGVVRIFNIRYNESTGKAGMGTGSGFILNNSGYIATNRHVIANTAKLLVTSRQGNNVYVRLAKVIKDDEARDLAIIQCSPIPGTVPTTLCIARPSPNLAVWSVGFPGLVDDDAKFESFFFKELFAREKVRDFRDLVLFLLRASESQVARVMSNNASAVEICSPSFGNGIVARMSKRSWTTKGPDLDVIVHSAKTVHGNSGGPLINSDGAVLGINTQIRGVVAQTQDGDSTINNEYGLSSFITELNSFARSQGVSTTTTDALPKPPPTPPAPGLHWFVKIILAGISFLALAGIAISLVKKGNPETFTQYLRRGGNMSKVRNELLGGIPPQNRHLAAPLPPPLPVDNHGANRPRHTPDFGPEPERHAHHPVHISAPTYTLVGRCTEGRSIRLAFTDRDIDENNGKLIIGRKEEMVNLFIEDHSLSRQHANIVRHGSSLYIEDHDSSNGTFVDEEKVGGDIEAIKLKPGSQVRLGSVTLTFDERE